ncbi:MAG TPA: hypothetical protein VGO18_22600, partial [Steroidobacteraceae bacterium]|nr:hypothetical protein [Steroidobacteraceae bacterium]
MRYEHRHIRARTIRDGQIEDHLAENRWGGPEGTEQAAAGFMFASRWRNDLMKVIVALPTFCL